MKYISDSICADKHKQLLMLRSKYNTLSANKTVAKLLKLKQTFYDQGEKTGKVLAWQIKKKQMERAVDSIEESDGNIIVDPQEINNSFRSYYMKLYNSECTSGSEIQKTFLDNLVLPSIPEEHKDEIGKDISLQEVVEAIDLMKAGKAAGPDGLPIDIYKKFKDKLVRPMLDMLVEAFTENKLPMSLNEAIITLLPKPGKPNNKSENF